MVKKIVIFIILVCAFLSCSKKKHDDMIYKMPDKVVFILVDTLRADHLPFYDYQYNTTPFLKGLTKNAVVFKNAFSTSSYTAPATASIFTGLYAKDHGVKIGLVSFKRGASDNLKLNKISKGVTTIARTFKEAGYNTFGFSDNINVSHTMGFDRGFDEFKTTEYVGAENVNKNILDIKDKITKSKKYFLYIHYMDPHQPYNLRQGFVRREKGRKRIRAYDSEISYTDNAIKKLYEEFRWDKDTLIIFTADHGESFGERKNLNGKREFGHGKTLYRELLHIPLFFYKNGLRSQNIKSQVFHLDILPTLSSLLGQNPMDYWEGIDLSNVLLGKDNVKPRYLYSDLAGKNKGKFHLPEVHSVIYKNFHYIETAKNELWPEQKKLFNWENDVSELGGGDVSQNPNYENLKERLGEHNARASRFKNEKVNIKLDSKIKNHLSSLGYIN